MACCNWVQCRRYARNPPFEAMTACQLVLGVPLTCHVMRWRALIGASAAQLSEDLEFVTRARCTFTSLTDFLTTDASPLPQPALQNPKPPPSIPLTKVALPDLASSPFPSRTSAAAEVSSLIPTPGMTRVADWASGGAAGMGGGEPPIAGGVDTMAGRGGTSAAGNLRHLGRSISGSLNVVGLTDSEAKSGRWARPLFNLSPPAGSGTAGAGGDGVGSASQALASMKVGGGWERNEYGARNTVLNSNRFRPT